MRTASFIASLALSLPAWGGYGYYVPVTIDHTKVPSTQANFPVYVCANGAASSGCDASAHANLSIPNLKSTGNGGKVTSSSGYDIGFFSNTACTTSLNYELAASSYVATTGAGEWHVLISSLSSSSDTVIYLCFGNSAVVTDQSTTATWNSNIKRVYHVPNGTTLTAADSTSSAENGTLVNTPTAVSGQLDGAADFVGASGQKITAATTSLPITGNAVSVSLWVKTTSTASSFALAYGTGGVHLYLGYGSPAAGRPYWGDATTLVSGSSTIHDGNWHQLHATYNGSNSRIIYVDGASNGSDANSLTMTIAAGQLAIGMDNNGSSFNCTCDIDEARVYDVELTANWITTEYNNQSSPWTFFTFGTEVSLGGSAGAARRGVIVF